MTRLHRLLSAFVILVAVSIGGGLAWGYFTAHGSASGAASAGTLVAVTVTAGKPTTPLQPGATGDVALKVTNPNTVAVKVTAVSFGTVGVSGGASCTASTSAVAFVSQSGLSVALAAGQTTTVDLSGAASMGSTSASGCQGASFSASATITVQAG